MLGVPKSTAGRWVRRYQESGEIARRPIPGRPRVSSGNDDETLEVVAKNNPFLTAAELKAKCGFPGSTQTLRNRLRRRRRHLNSNDAMEEHQSTNNLPFLTVQAGFVWETIIFSGGVTFECTSTGPVHMDDPCNMATSANNGLISVSCWGWMSHGGAGVLERIQCQLDTSTYLHILEHVLLPSARVLYPEGSIIFQQDNNHPAYMSEEVQAWFKRRRKDIELLDWLGSSISPELGDLDG
ncbi:hypothetical protein C0J52_12581 [Blattella germanica]|nr:hypothetical protein C0J52_12581 [Blattella germanica]